jgi:glycosyltransferase involved in cell wall biosynthesis
LPEQQITTIIPTFRRPKMLRRAIKSVLAQTYPNFQVMVLDNASGDETARVVAELAREDPRVKYHCHPENIGLVPNFDYGMRHVETPFFSFLSDDDVVLPHFYETAMKGFRSHPDAMFSAGVTLVTARGDGPWGPQSIALPLGRHEPPYGAIEMALSGPPNWTAVLFRKEAIERTGYLAPNTMSADTEFELRIALSFPFVVSHRLCAFRIRHSGSYSETARLEMLWPNWGNMMRSLGRQYDVDLRARRRLLGIMARSLVRRLRRFCTYAIRTRRFDEAHRAATVLREDLGRKSTGLLLQAVTSASRRFPWILLLLNGLSGVRCAIMRGVRADRKEGGDWAGWAEAERHSHLIGSPS